MDEAAETFGFQPLVWGLFLILASALLAAMEKSPDAGEYAVLSALGLCGAALVGYEIRRRRRRTMLRVSGAQVEVHRNGRLDLAVRRDEILPYALQGTNTVKILVGMGLWVALFAALALMASTPMERILAGSGVLAFSASTASLVRTRIRCRYYLVPKRSGRMELVSLTREAERRIRG